MKSDVSARAKQTKGDNKMRTYLYCEAGFVEKAQWLPNSWVNVVCPNNDDFEFLTKTLNVPESFLNDIADCNANSASLAAFQKRFFQHFNAFMIIKYLNFVHPDPFPLVKITPSHVQY